MSQRKLVDGYLEGSVSRRSFVRGLMATGVSAGAAAGYAQLLGTGSAEAAPRIRRAKVDDTYPLLTTKIVTRDLSDVRHHKRLRIKATSTVDTVLHIGAFLEKGGHLIPLGFVPYEPSANRTVDAFVAKMITIPFNQNANGLAGLHKASIYVETTSSGYLPFAVARATLK